MSLKNKKIERIVDRIKTRINEKRELELKEDLQSSVRWEWLWILLTVITSPAFLIFAPLIILPVFTGICWAFNRVLRTKQIKQQRTLISKEMNFYDDYLSFYIEDFVFYDDYLEDDIVDPLTQMLMLVSIHDFIDQEYPYEAFAEDLNDNRPDNQELFYEEEAGYSEEVDQSDQNKVDDTFYKD